MEYFITGFPGTGKSSVADVLRNRGYTVFDVDKEKALTKWINKNTGEIAVNKYKGTPEFYDNHDFCWDREYLKKLLEETPTKPVFILGLTSNQTEDLDLFRKVFLLKAERGLLR